MIIEIFVNREYSMLAMEFNFVKLCILIAMLYAGKLVLTQTI